MQSSSTASNTSISIKRILKLQRPPGDFEREREVILKASSLWGAMVFDMFNSKLNVTGLENVPDEGPVVFVGNHQGYADIIAYCAAFKKFQFGFVAKEELAKIPLYGPWIRRIRSVFIERDDPRASLEAINRGIEYIEQGFSLVIFPEGTRSKGPDPGEFRKGSLKLATKPKVPIIPVSLDGSYKFFEENRPYNAGGNQHHGPSADRNKEPGSKGGKASS